MMIIIYGIDNKLNPVKQALSNTIHDCMKSILGMPDDKRAHRFIPMKKEDFYYPGDRTDAYTVIEINLIEGRKAQTIKLLILSLFEAIEKNIGIQPIDVEITVHEQPSHCWGFRGITGDDAKLNYQVKV